MASRSTHGRSPLIVAIGGGKGGVGKSVVGANLGVAMARLGFRIIIVDADLGSANQHTLFGIDRPGTTIQALFDRSIESLEEAVHPTGIPKLSLVPGASAVVGAANPGHARKLKLIRHIQSLDADAILVDCGAGSGLDTLDFYEVADRRLLVVTPQLTSMQNAYGFLKGAVYRAMRHVALNARETDLFNSEQTTCETERVDDLLARIRGLDATFTRALEQCLRSFNTGIVGNQLEHDGQQRALLGLSRMYRDFLRIEVPVLGGLPASPQVHASITNRVPLLKTHPTSRFARILGTLAEDLLSTDVARVRESRRRRDDDVEATLPGPSANHLRRHRRVRVDLAAEIRHGGQLSPAKVTDVSDGGLGVFTELKVKRGETVEVSFTDRRSQPPVRAFVRHVDAKNGRIGLEYESEEMSERARNLTLSLVKTSIRPAAAV